MLEISGKHARLAVVTGGNKGVGLQVCRQLALQGVTVILTARDEERGEVAAESLRRESDLTDIIFHQLDVRDDDSAASLARYIESRYGKLDILVNCTTLLFLLLVNGTTLCLLGIRK
jgi:(+)-neomenthol dehydrogenase